MFRISRRLDYGLQLMITLAEDPENNPIATATLAEKLSIPLPFLHQIGHTLMQTGLIKATPGPKGGLRLNQAADEISILRISEALEGPLCVNPCVGCDGNCPHEDHCMQKTLWTELQESITEYLGSITLRSLVKGERLNLTMPLELKVNSNKLMSN